MPDLQPSAPQVQTGHQGSGKSPYVLGICVATLGYGLSRLEPAIRGPKLWAIFLCASFAIWISVLKLRRLIHGTG